MRSSICVSDIKLSRVDLEISGEERVSSEERKKGKRGQERGGKKGRVQLGREWKGNIASVQIVGLRH